MSTKPLNVSSFSSKIFESIYSHMRHARDARAFASTCKAARNAFLQDHIQYLFITKYFRCSPSSRMPSAEHLLRRQALRAGNTCLHPLGRLKNHINPLSWVQLAVDETKAIAYSQNNLFDIWNIDTCKKIKSFTAPCATLCIQLSSDGSQMFLGTDLGSIIICDSTTGERLDQIEAHTQQVTCLQTTFDGLKIFSGSLDKTLKIWNLKPKECLHTFQKLTSAPSSLQLSYHNEYAVAGFFDGRVMLWNLSSKQLLRTLRQPIPNPITCIGISPDNSTLLVGSTAPALTMWNIATVRQIDHLSLASNPAAISIHPDGTSLWVCNVEGYIDYYDFTTLDLLRN